MRLAIALVLFSPSAWAIDFTSPVIDPEGVAICMEQKEPCPEDKIATLGRVSRVALYTSFADEQNLSGEDKYKRAELAQAISGAKDIKLKSEDIVLLKKLIGKLYSPPVVFGAWNLLEGKDAK